MGLISHEWGGGTIAVSMGHNTFACAEKSIHTPLPETALSWIFQSPSFQVHDKDFLTSTSARPQPTTHEAPQFSLP